MTTFKNFAAIAAAITLPRYPDNRQELAPRLIDQSHRNLVEELQQQGNATSRAHRAALEDYVEGLTQQSFGIRAGRCAYAMPCGAGKTLGLIVWLATAWKLGAGISVAVSAFQIEALCKIKDGLIERGVPEADIGLRHSLGNTARWPNTDDADRPIMLVSHVRIRNGREADLFIKHQGRPRNLLVWDESLLTTQATSLLWSSVKSAGSAVLDMLKRQSPLRASIARAMDTLDSEATRQREGAGPSTLELFLDIDPQAADSELRGLRGLDRQQRTSVETMRALLRLAQRPVAMALPEGGGGNGLIHYVVALPAELHNIAVLDASYAIRTLAQGQEGDIEDCTTPAMRTFKSYERVTAREVLLCTGRHTLTRPDRKREAELCRRVAECLAAVPAGERVLIVTFKDESVPGPLRGLVRGLTAEGVDLKATTVDGKQRISWLTWGRETSLNEFKDCKHVILAGVLRRDHLDLTACLAGHKGDLLYRGKVGELQALELSEAAHCVLQAMHRGACRLVDADGRAHEMHLTIFANIPGLRSALMDSLPGVQWRTEGTTRTATTADSIRAHLEGLPAGVLSISSKALNKAVPHSLKSGASWQEALTVALDALRGKWTRGARSIFRVQGAA